MLLFEIGTSALDTELLETFVLTPPPLDRLRRYSLLCFDTKQTAVIIVVFLSVSATACREYISELGLRLIRLCQWLLLWATRTGHAAPAAFRPGNRPGRRRAPTPRPGPFVGIAAAPEAEDRFHLGRGSVPPSASRPSAAADRLPLYHEEVARRLVCVVNALDRSIVDTVFL